MRLVLLMITFGGLFCLFKAARPRLQVFWWPTVSVSLITVVTYLGGIFRCMGVTNVLLYMLSFEGYVLVGRRVIKPGGTTARSSWSIGMELAFVLVFFVAVTSAFFVFSGRFLFVYGDFSHWGTVARIVSAEQRFPVMSDDIYFNSYPLGSASFIAFCSTILGNSADSYLFSQTVMILSYILSLFSLIDRKGALRISTSKGNVLTGVLILVVASFCVLFTLYNCSVESLCVDNLLAVACISAALMIYGYSACIDAVIPEMALTLCAIVSIKNSGVFLAVIIAALALYFPKDTRRRGILLILIPLAFFAAWRLHVSLTFSTVGKHDMSVENYSSVFATNRVELANILKIILPWIAFPARNHALIVVGIMAITLFLADRESRKPLLVRVCLVAALVVLYEIGMLLMYILSMPVEEIVYQQGKDFIRYNGTLVCITAGLALEYAVRLLFTTVCARNVPGRCVWLSVLCLAAVFVVLCLNIVPIESKEVRVKAYGDAYALNVITREHTFPDHAGYVVFFQAPDVVGYNQWCAQYYLRSRNIKYAYDESTALDMVRNTPGSYYLDLGTRTVQEPSI